MAILKDVGIVTAYGYAKENGYEGTESEYGQLMANFANAAAQAVAAKDDAVQAKEDAETARTEAKNYAESVLRACPTDTASGPIASFPDGADGVPVKSLVVNVEPNQDLHGYDNPWPAGGGKNKCPYIQTVTYQGVTTATNERGVTSVTGTATGAGGRLSLCTPAFTLPAGTYTISHNGTGTWGYALVVSMAGGASTAEVRNSATSMTFTLNEEASVVVGLSIESGTAYNGTVSAQIESGSTKTAFAPYQNLCPITGWTGANVTGAGVNLLNPSVVFDNDTYYTVNSDGSITIKSSDGRAWENVPACPLKAGTYTLSRAEIGGMADIRLSTEGYATPHLIGASGLSVTVTLEKDGYVKIKGGYAPATYPFTAHYQLEPGSTATAYEPYAGQVIPITWQTEAGTVYGGTLDVTSGVLTVDKAKVKISELSWDTYSSPSSGIYRATIDNLLTPSSVHVATTAISDALRAKEFGPISGADYGYFAISHGYNPDRIAIPTNGLYTTVQAFLAAMGNIEIVYPLASPLSYQLSGEELTTLLGQNNIFADCGDTSVTYRADIGLFIDKKLAQALNA